MTVVVYGAGSAIGEAVVDAFLQEGRTVVAVDHNPLPAALRDRAARNNGGARLALVDCDGVPGPGFDTAGLFSRCEQAAGGEALRTLVCVAPPVGQVAVLDVEADDMRRIVDLELVVPALLMQEAARRMVAQGGGQIIVFCSMSAKTGVHTLVAPFAAAKGGLLSYMRTMAAEVARHGVTVNGIATSLFEPQVALMPDEERAQIVLGIPARRFGKASEAAGAAVYLASEQAAFITGETLNLSGGRFMD